MGVSPRVYGGFNSLEKLSEIILLFGTCVSLQNAMPSLELHLGTNVICKSSQSHILSFVLS